jgi:hypothetical protein
MNTQFLGMLQDQHHYFSRLNALTSQGACKGSRAAQKLVVQLMGTSSRPENCSVNGDPLRGRE